MSVARVLACVCAGGRKICAGAIMCAGGMGWGIWVAAKLGDYSGTTHKGIVSRLWRGLAVTGRRYTIDV